MKRLMVKVTTDSGREITDPLDLVDLDFEEPGDHLRYMSLDELFFDKWLELPLEDGAVLRVPFDHITKMEFFTEEI